ncbi:MAG: formyltetrahydrofolate deformylase [Myxococcota bacterium]|nr:formyltetrahydrofolate deformylase [Myxococcota bacterium]
MSASENPSPTATLLVACDDCPGLVAALAQALYNQGANILHAEQHTDSVAGRFFQRIRFEDAELMGPDREAAESRLLATVRTVGARYDMKWQLRFEERPMRMAIFVSKTDHCLYDLLLRHRSGELLCEIPLIVSNHESLRPVAEQFGVPFQVFPIDSKSKAEVEVRELEMLAENEIDLVVMARYMQILTEDFIGQFKERIINIHHSFLPAFAGGRPYHQAFDRGVKLIGATAHYATGDLDEGPIIEQDVIHVSHRESVADLVRLGKDVERTVLSRAVRLHLESRIFVHDNRTVVFTG